MPGLAANAARAGGMTPSRQIHPPAVGTAPPGGQLRAAEFMLPSQAEPMRRRRQKIVVIQQELEARLRAALMPTHLEVVNESGMHSVPEGSESHFNVLIVAGAFREQSRVERQRAVYAAVSELLATKVHAFTMKALTPEEWTGTSGGLRASPDCRGGAASEGRF